MTPLAHKPKPVLLIVDDDDLCRRQLTRLGSTIGCQVEAVSDPDVAMKRIAQGGIDVVLTDLCMPAMSGTDLIKRILAYEKTIPCILMTGFGSADKAADALRAGAFWYLPKPFDGGGQAVRRLVERALEHRQLQHQKLDATKNLDSGSAPCIVGGSSSLQSLLDQATQVARTDATVLIEGESGTGKDLVAQTIHARSLRSSKPFVAMNCGAIPEELLESELFGHTKGSFTHATSAREGRFARADGGTIFLDEVGDMSLRFQVKLLRVLETGDFQPVGSSATQNANVRIIAATNQDLADSVRRQTFRSDLYYRLNVVPLRVPPLRERREDIPDLIAHFVEKFRQRSGQFTKEVSPDTVAALCQYPWPGNIRELENMVERLMVLSDTQTVERHELPFHLKPAVTFGDPEISEQVGFREAVDRFEASLILQALDDSQWNKSAAAESLGIKRTTLVDMVRRKRLQGSKSA